jgi:hypothetical protein
MDAAGEQVEQIDLPLRGEKVTGRACPLDHLEVLARRPRPPRPVAPGAMGIVASD